VEGLADAGDSKKGGRMNRFVFSDVGKSEASGIDKSSLIRHRERRARMKVVINSS
jgi:hypothetical protein